MDPEWLETAVDLLLGVRATESMRTEVRRDIKSMCLEFVESESWQENLPSVGTAARQLAGLNSACRAIILGWEDGNRPALAQSLQVALEPFLDLSPYGVRHWLEGDVPTLDGEWMVPANGQIVATAAGKETLLSIALQDLAQGNPLSPKCGWFIGKLAIAADSGERILREHRGTGKGPGGAPLHPSWAPHDLVVACLDLWEKHAPGKASRTPGSRFVCFVSRVFELATGDPAMDHGRVIRSVMRKWRARERPVRVGRPPKPDR